MANLQTRVETLTTTNALMKEDLAISKNTILAMQEENRQLKHKIEQQKLESSTTVLEQESSSQRHYCSSDTEVDAAQAAVESDNTNSSDGLSVKDLSKKLHDERTQREHLEGELESVKRQKDEMEVAMKLMEKTKMKKKKREKKRLKALDNVHHLY